MLPILTENALKVLEKRYLIRDEKGEVVETPEQLFRRVAKAIASVEKENREEIEELFYNAMASCVFMPNTPCLMNAGRENQMLSACFVLPVEDNMEGIFDAIKWAAIIHKRGGGTGFSFSRLRAKNSIVQSTHGIASGPVSFMKVFNAATEAVKQGGSRRGANMGILRVDHPDILEFIDCKQDLTQVTNFNISVGVTDEFMTALENNTTYNLFDQNGKIVGSLLAKEVFDKLVLNAWKTGEPGLVFLDEMNRRNPGREFEEIEATNPCGEIPLPPFDVCNLLSMNIGLLVVPSKEDPRRYVIDVDKLQALTILAVRFLDNIVTINDYPIEQIRQQALKSRRIGLGIMGWADALIKMGIKYDSEEAISLAESLMTFIYEVANKYSQKLAEERGEVYNLGRRNTTLTMIAPTGTISIIAGCSSGIEPLYAVAFTRNVMEGTRLTEVNPMFEAVAKERGFYSPELMERVAAANTLEGFTEIPEDVKSVFRTAADVSPEWHVKMQAVFQKYCDSAVSKTINLPYEATQEDVEKAYRLAHKLKCKGITVYRDGSRPGQVLSTGATPEAARNSEQIGAFGTIATEKPVVKPRRKTRPDRLDGFTEKIQTGYGNLYVTVNEENGIPVEVFTQIGKSGLSILAHTEALGRMISLALRSGAPITEVISQLQGIGGSQPLFSKEGLIASIPDAIAKVLQKEYPMDPSKKKHLDFLPTCSNCNTEMIPSGGCFYCGTCGNSKC